MKVAILYRVLQAWRTPVFERLANEYELKVFYGCDFPGTKVVSATGSHSFKSKKMFSIPLSLKMKSGNMLIPFSPSVFFDLMYFNPDVVICEGASNFLNNLPAFLYCKIFNKPMIQWGLGQIRGKKTSLLRRTLDPFIKPIERRASSVISYSSYGANYYRNLGFKNEDIFVAVNVVDTSKRLAEIDCFYQNIQTQCYKDNVFRVLFVGAIEENKRLDMLVNAFSLFRSKYENVELHIIGDGFFRSDIESLCKSLNISDSVVLYGAIQGPLIDVIYNMDVFVMPGLGGLAVSDMLCHGIPVICSVGDGSEADLINGSNGLIIEEIDEHKIESVLCDLIENPEKLEYMEYSARKTIDTYNIESYIKNIKSAIEHSAGKYD